MIDGNLLRVEMLYDNSYNLIFSEVVNIKSLNEKDLS